MKSYNILSNIKILLNITNEKAKTLKKTHTCYSTKLKYLSIYQITILKKLK